MKILSVFIKNILLIFFIILGCINIFKDQTIFLKTLNIIGLFGFVIIAFRVFSKNRN